MELNQKKILDEILIITLEIKEKLPQLYQHLDETPMHFENNSKGIDLQKFKEYLKTIRAQLKEGIRSEKKSIPTQN